MVIISAPPPIPGMKCFFMTESWATRRSINARTWWRPAGPWLIQFSTCGKHWQRVIFQTTLLDHGVRQKPRISLPVTAAHGERSRPSAAQIHKFRPMGVDVKILPDNAALAQAAAQEFHRIAEAAVQ